VSSLETVFALRRVRGLECKQIVRSHSFGVSSRGLSERSEFRRLAKAVAEGSLFARLPRELLATFGGAKVALRADASRAVRGADGAE